MVDAMFLEKAVSEFTGAQASVELSGSGHSGSLVPFYKSSNPEAQADNHYPISPSNISSLRIPGLGDLG